jgi:toxin ParE1/3/4
MERYRIVPLARLDLDEIYVYIARDNPAAAARWLSRAMEKFSWLAKNPACGEDRNSIYPGLRCISHGRYVIYFRLRPEQLDIVRVLHGARDHSGLL